MYSRSSWTVKYIICEPTTRQILISCERNVIDLKSSKTLWLIMTSQHQAEAVSFKNIKLFKDQILGIGSYGKVCKVKCDNLLCAAKLIHETIFDPNAQQLIAVQRQHRLPMRRFEQECEFMNSIRHPNIVQYLGLYQDTDTGLPVLLMELMDDSLTHFVESCTQPIPYHIQVNICHDITVALSFLHSNNIVHRDLSSNNVLLTGNVRAKVTDFGMARLGDGNPQATQLTLTMCPGTDVYMPPEAVQDKPGYSEKIDCFSFGVITIQILTRKFPKPGDRRKRVEINHPGLPIGMYDMVVTEIERRQNHIIIIDPNNTLLQVALLCLKDRDVERPSAQQLCERVAALKDSTEYSESVRAAQEKNTPEQSRDGEREREVRLLRQQIQGLDQTIVQKDENLREKDKYLREKDEMIAAEQQQVREKEYENDRLEREKNRVIEEKERQLRQVHQQLEESEQLIAHFQRRIAALEHRRRPSNVDQWTSSNVISRSKDESISSRPRIKMTWREGRKAPCEMSTSHNTVVDDTTLYVRAGSKTIYAYLISTSSWSQLPDRPTYSCPSVIVNNLLTLVGGIQSHTITNQLFSLTGEGSGRRWNEKFPPMPTKRCGSTALCTGTALIVAGGRNECYYPLLTVEVMNTCTEALQWSTAAALPKPVWCVPSAVCGDYVYILSLESDSKSMYTCPVSTLIRSCWSRPTADVWNVVAAPQVTRPACVSIFGRLLTIGGIDCNHQPTAAVYMYNPTTDSWEHISLMRIPRYDCFAAVLLNNKLIVVGGETDVIYQNSIDSVEIATIELQN